MSRRFRFSLAGWAILACVSFSALASHSGRADDVSYPAPGSACHLASDQAFSLMSPVRTLPIRVILDSDLSDVNVSALEKAVDQWNRFGRASLGTDFFRIDRSATADYSRFKARADYCSFGLDAIPQGLLVISEDSSADWDSGMGVDAEARGVTRRCSMGDGTRQTQQIVVINSADTDISQRATVFLHELGHVVGLNHSCKPGSSEQYYRNCDDLRTDDPYREAVMFPSLVAASVNTSDLSQMYKEELQANDVERAYCLYKNLR